MKCSKLAVAGLIVLGMVPGLLFGVYAGAASGYGAANIQNDWISLGGELASNDHRIQDIAAEREATPRRDDDAIDADARAVLAERNSIAQRIDSLDRLVSYRDAFMPLWVLVLAGVLVAVGGALVYAGRQTGATDQLE